MENNQLIPIEEKGEIVLYQPDDKSSEFVGSTILVSVFRDSERTKSEGLDRLGEVEHENLEYSCKIICEILEF